MLRNQSALYALSNARCALNDANDIIQCANVPNAARLFASDAEVILLYTRDLIKADLAEYIEACATRDRIAAKMRTLSSAPKRFDNIGDALLWAVAYVPLENAHRYAIDAIPHKDHIIGILRQDSGASFVLCVDNEWRLWDGALDSTCVPIPYGWDHV